MRYLGLGSLLLTCLSSFLLTMSSSRFKLPLTDNESYCWVSSHPNRTRPDNCANCHAQIYQEWVNGKHAHSADDPHFLNIRDGTTWIGNKAGWSLHDEMPDGA